MIKKVSLMIALVAIVTSVSFGQIKFGVKTGLNLSNVKMSGGGVSIDNKMYTGFMIGGFVNYSINDKLSVQPEILFAQYGCNFDEDIFGPDVEPLKENYISIPIVVKYSIGAIHVLAGPQLGYLLSAEVDGDDATGTDAFDMKKMDAGIALGAGYEWEIGLGIDARYYLGLANITNQSGFEMKNRSIQVAVFYKFK